MGRGPTKACLSRRFVAMHPRRFQWSSRRCPDGLKTLPREEIKASLRTETEFGGRGVASELWEGVQKVLDCLCGEARRNRLFCIVFSGVSIAPQLVSHPLTSGVPCLDQSSVSYSKESMGLGGVFQTNRPLNPRENLGGTIGAVNGLDIAEKIPVDEEEVSVVLTDLGGSPHGIEKKALLGRIRLNGLNETLLDGVLCLRGEAAVGFAADWESSPKRSSVFAKLDQQVVWSLDSSRDPRPRLPFSSTFTRRPLRSLWKVRLRSPSWLWINSPWLL